MTKGNVGADGSGVEPRERVMGAQVRGRSRAVAVMALVAVALASAPLFAPQVAVATAGGGVVATGDNALGELGTGSTANSATAVQVSGLSTSVLSVASTAFHTLALKSDGTVAAWGSNASGQLGDGSASDRSTPVAVVGLTGVGCPAVAPPTCVAIAAGGAHSLALKTDGSVVAWGSNNWGQLGNGTSIDSITPSAVTGLGASATNPVVGIAAGGAHSLAVKADGSMVAWGDDANGQLGNGATSSTATSTPVAVTGLPASPVKVTSISAGSGHSLAVTSAGGALAWGANGNGQLGNNTTADSSTPVAVTFAAGTPGVMAIAAGSNHSLSIMSDGSVCAWGANGSGQLGDGTRVNRPAPVSVSVGGVAGTVNKLISGGGAHSVVARSDGTAYAWGANQYGELGDGTTVDRLSSIQVSGVAGATSIAAGREHSVFGQASPGTAPGSGAALPAPPPVLQPGTASAPAGLPKPENVAATAVDIATNKSPVLAADPARPGHLAMAYRDQAFTHCLLALSADGGLTWTAEILIGTNGVMPVPQSITAGAPTFDRCLRPSLAFGSNGTLYYEFGAGKSFGYSNQFLTASKDDGVSFVTAQQIDRDAAVPSDPAGGGGDTFGDLAVDASGSAHDGYVYASYGRFAPSSATGTVQTTSCSPAAIATYLAGGTLDCGASVRPSDSHGRAPLEITSTVGSDGRYSVAWSDYGFAFAFNFSISDGPYPVFTASSTNQGQSFSSPRLVDNIPETCPFFVCPSGQVGQPRVNIAGGRSPGQIFFASSGPRSDGSPGRIALTTSTDGGNTWSPRRLVGVPQPGPVRVQYEPQIGVAPNGRLDIDYYDVGLSGSQDVDVISSTDGGATFNAPRKVDEVSSSQSNLGGYFNIQRIGLVSSDLGFYAAWPDDRRASGGNGKTDIFVATNAPLTGVVGGDSAMYRKRDDQPFLLKGGLLLAAPAVTSVPTATGGASALYVGVGGDRQLYVRSDTTTWQVLVPSGSACLDSPAAVVTPDGAGGNTLTVACTGTDHAMYYAQTSVVSTSLPTVAGAFPFQPLGGALIAGPAVAPVNGTLTFFAEGTDHFIYSRTASPDSTFLKIQSPAACNGHPAVAAFGADAYMACQGLDGRLYYSKNTAGAGWAPFMSAGGQLIDGPGIAASSTGVTMYVEGTNQHLFHTVTKLDAQSSSPFVDDGGLINFGAGAAGIY